MKFLVVTPAYYPDTLRGGSVTGCRNLVKSLSCFSKVSVASIDTTNDGPRRSKVDNIDVFYFEGTPGLEWLSKSGWGFSISFTFWFLKNFSKFDLIYIRSFWNYISLITALICIFTNTKYGFSSSGKFTKAALKTSKIKKLVVFPLSYLILKSSSFIHYPSEEEYLNSIKLIRSLTRKVIAPTAVDIKQSFDDSNYIKNKKIDLIYTVSRFDRIKGLHNVAKAFISLDQSIDMLHVGDFIRNKSYYNEIIQIYKKANISIYHNLDLISIPCESKRVFIPGYLDLNSVDKICIKRPFNIFVQMSFSEGLSNSVLEALARNSPCIVSPGCNMKVFEINKAITISKPIELAKNIDLLSSDENKLISIIRNQREMLLNLYSHESIGSTLVSQFEYLI